MAAGVFALNSNLILLIRINGDTHKFAEISFKFQSDSINTHKCRLTVCRSTIFKFQSDSINTLAYSARFSMVADFKFQSDSINTGKTD